MKSRALNMSMKVRAATTFARVAACVVLLVWLAAVPALAQQSSSSVALARGWQFLADPAGALKVETLGEAREWREVRVGLSWNAQFEDLRDYMGAAWYRTRFDAPDTNGGRRVLVRFGAVDYYSEVFVNGTRVGEHEGGYTPFDFDITQALRPGANELVVRVIDPPMNEQENRARFPQMMYNEIPHGKQNWYVQTGGIWQPVWLDIKPADYIKSVRVTANLDGKLEAVVLSNSHLGPPPPAPPPGASPRTPRPQTLLERITVRATGPDGRTFPLKLTGGGGLGENDYVFFEGLVPNPQLWSTEQPNLYTLDVTLGDDHMTTRFGFRKFEARDGKFYLNNQPFYMRAALDQDFYPETIYTPPSKQYVRDQMQKGKRLGLNLLRCHIKVCDPSYLEAADEVGMLVWYEVPSWNDAYHFTPEAAARGEQTLQAMVERDWNHPSIIIQSIINESWGADLKQQAQRVWLRAAFDRAKKLTGPLGRLIVDNSACCENFHVKTDIEDNHRYNSIPDERAAFDKWVADFASRPRWNFSPFGDAVRTGKEPLVLSEFGNWGLPKLPKDLPWWFGRDFGGRPVTRPAGVFDRFREYGFGTMFGDYNALAEATQWHQFASLKHEIEEIRRHSSIQGYVITEFTDINWEVNGLLDMWRNPKVYAEELSRLQQPDVILARPPKYNLTSGERLTVEAFFSHYGERKLDSLSVKFTFEGGSGGEERYATIDSAGVTRLRPLQLVAPQVDKPVRRRLRLEARAADGSLVADNSYDFFIYPKPAPARNVSLAFYDPKAAAASGGAQGAPGDAASRQGGSGLAQALASAGYRVSPLAAGGAPQSGGSSVLIATALDSRVEAHLRAGGRAVLLLDAKEAIPASASFQVTPRAGSDLDGNWVTNYNWVRTESAPFRNLGFNKILGFEAERVTPRHIIQGIAGQDYGDVLAGIFYGWLNNNAALAVQMRAGEGRFLATTLRFDDYGRDPYATHLLDAIIGYVGSSEFAPRLVYRTGAAARR